MALRVYNTLSRKVEDFVPVDDGNVKVYICGLTTYDFMHIGHSRTYIAFDIILRYLKFRGFKVKYIQNITDIDDKIIKRAREKGIDPLELSRDFAAKSLEDQKSLGLLPADYYPKVSESIGDIINAIKVLVDKGHAYVLDGSVYFDISTFPDYGKLSNQNTEELHKHRIEPNPKKKSPLDFSLWKKSNEGELGFESPWGFGRPGWHIECSAMSNKHLGKRFDIHGGALDLIFPHHENEIAQSESLTGSKPFVKYWLHTGFLNSSGEKMSKSLGNILPVREFLKNHSASAFRLFIIQTHYRSPIDYSEVNVANAEAGLERLRNFRVGLDSALKSAKDSGSSEAAVLSRALKEKFIEAMDDDFNTSQAVAAVFDTVRGVNVAVSKGSEAKSSLELSIQIFDEIMSVFGLSFASAEFEVSSEVEKLISERNRLRAEKKWAEADVIRAELLKRGIKLVDKADGTTATEKVDV